MINLRSVVGLHKDIGDSADTGEIIEDVKRASNDKQVSAGTIPVGVVGNRRKHSEVECEDNQLKEQGYLNHILLLKT